MNLFFDTSALIKFFHEEEGTETVTGIITDDENKVFVSELTRIEFLSALHRRYRNKELNEHSLADAIRGFNEEYIHFHVEPLGSAIVHEAENLVKDYGKTHGLRTLDALHLATFILIKEDDWFFVACDDNLINTAKANGAAVFNPVKRT